MDLSLSQIAMLIEMTGNEIAALKKVIDNASSSEEQVDDSGELILQYISLESTLENIYKEKWHPDSGEPRYEELRNS
jgi:hypothetical protein